MDERDNKALNATEKIQNGTILVAKQRCTMISGQDALIIGKEYTAENVCSKDFTVNSEVSKAHYFSFNNNDGSGCWSDYFDLKTQVTTTNIDFIPKHMTNLTTRNKRGYRIAIILLLLAMLTTAAYLFKVVKDTTVYNEQHLIDSLNTLHAIEVKRLNHAQMVLLNNINDSDKRNQMLVNENKALQERSNLQTVQYTNVINRIKQSAPMPCQIYIDSVDNECAKVVNAKDDVIDGLITRLDNRDSTIVDRDSLIAVKQARIETDSSNYVMNKAALQEENKQLVKSTKRTNFWGKIAIGAAVVWTGFVMWVTISK